MVASHCCINPPPLLLPMGKEDSTHLRVSALLLLFLLPLPGTQSFPQQECFTLPNDGQKDRRTRMVVQEKESFAWRPRQKAPPSSAPQSCGTVPPHLHEHPAPQPSTWWWLVAHQLSEVNKSCPLQRTAEGSFYWDSALTALYQR